MVRQLCFEVWYLLAECLCKVSWLHTHIDLIPAIWLDDLLGALLIIVKLTTDHVDQLLRLNEFFRVELAATCLFLLSNLEGLWGQTCVIQES